MTDRVYIDQTPNHVGETVTCAGWIDSRRDHGKIVFLDIRDRSAKVQVVLVPNSLDEASQEVMKQVRPEWVVQFQGFIKQRPAKLVNPDLVTGTIEIEATQLTVLNQAQTPEIPLDQEKDHILDELRLQYRYLDLRREKMQDNLAKRHKVTKTIRDYLEEQSFWEIETPLLSASTPEGARDFVVPSRNQPGNFYALPQSPQQYKQLLMASGVERYFQIARCFRDEDTRRDRQPEFTQLDLEMSFTSEEEMIQLNEELLIHVVRTLYPEKTITQVPFPRLSYQEVMDTYGTDAPDLRQDPDNPEELAFCWIVDFPQFERTDTGAWTFSHNPFSAPRPEWHEALVKQEQIENIISSQYDIVLNGFEIGGGSMRAHRAEMLQAVFDIIGYDKEVQKQAFGHMMHALGSGMPPHGGIAWGLDRLLAILQKEPNIREVMAFPKTSDGRDPMMVSPDAIEVKQLVELGLKKV